MFYDAIIIRAAKGFFMKFHQTFFGLLAIAVLAVILTSVGVNVQGTPFEQSLTISSGYKHISDPEGKSWDVQFEYPVNSTFSGVVRHTSRWHDDTVPFMSHDILVTTGDFADADLVRTSVSNHHFRWRADEQPAGSINLLHIFPATEEIYDQLNQIEEWDQVSITGREILKINRFDANGEKLGYWTDTGCNSILVTSVKVEP